MIFDFEESLIRSAHAKHKKDFTWTPTRETSGKIGVFWQCNKCEYMQVFLKSENPNKERQKG